MSRIDAAFTLSLRIKALETLIGQNPQTKPKSGLLGNGDGDGEESRQNSILQRATLIDQSLKKAVQGDEAIVNFLHSYSQNSPYLSPSFFLPSHSNSYGEGSSTQDDFSNLLSPSSSELDPLSQFSLLLEAESDLRSLEKQLSECQSLDDRKVLESGKLADHFDLIPKLRQLREESTAKDTELRGMEIRMQNLCNEYGQWVDSVSKLFIIFDRALNDMELKVAQKERERDRRAGTLDEDKKEEGRR